MNLRPTTWPAPDPAQRVAMDPPAEHVPADWFRKRDAWARALSAAVNGGRSA